MRRTLYLGLDDWMAPPGAMADRALSAAYLLGLRDFADVFLYRCTRPAFPRWVLGFNADVGVYSHRHLTAMFQGGHEFRNDTGFRVLPEDVDPICLEPHRPVSTRFLALRSLVSDAFGRVWRV